MKILLFTFCYLLFAIGNASAQELSVSIDPPIIQVVAVAPSSITTPIVIKNQSDQTITYDIFLKPFKETGEKNGEPSYYNSLPDYYKKFFRNVKVTDQNQSITVLTLAPSESKDLELKINIPKGEPPKDYYFSVVFISKQSEKNQEASFLGARAGIGTNVLLSIGPKSKTQGNISDFQGPKFVTGGPVEFVLEITNTSSHYLTPSGNVVIKNMFGQTVGNIDLISVNILANSKRLIPNIFWDEKFLLGFYRADLSLALSEEGPLLEKSISFFAFPLEAVFGTVVAAILVVGMIRRARKPEESN